MIKKNKKIITTLLITSFLITGCGKVSDKEKGDEVMSQKDYVVNEKISDNFGTDMNNFAFDLYDQLSSNDKNILFSPYSVSCALSMLDNAAEGNTKTELEKALQINDGLENRNSDLKLFAEGFNDKKAVLNTGNSTWISESLDLKKDAEENYFGPITYYYNAEGKQVDFTDKSTVGIINSWIEEKTEGMLPNMISELSPENQMCIINAVYFKGEWTTTFNTNDTIEDYPFEGVNGEREVDMMEQSGESYKYVETEGLKGISLPYGDENIVMDVWIADDQNTKNAVEVFGNMSNDERNELFKSLDNSEKTEIEVLQIPKFEVETSTFSLTEALKGMGINEAFVEGGANFSILNDELFVTDVLHKAKIIVEENGTEAAAATVVTMEKCSLIDDYDKLKYFIADKPFLYSIRDTKTGTILFLGTYVDVE